MTKPDVYIGFTPTLGAGHGNHQQAGRLIWEGMLAAANPAMFPDQLTGPHALSTWQVKKIFSGGSTAGTGGTTTAADCTTGFIPTPGTNLDTVVGAWTGYDSPYLWPAGNVQGKPAGTPKIWAQVASEGSSAYPTQSRMMFQGSANPGCSRFGQTMAFVPFQPNTNPDGTANPLAGKDNAILYGATVQDPGGLPLGTLEYLTFSSFFNVAGQPFTATLHLTGARVGGDPGRHGRADRAGGLDGRRREADRADRCRRLGDRRLHRHAERVGGRRTTSRSRRSSRAARRPATRTTSSASCRRSRAVSTAGASGREFDQWLNGTAPQALRLGRSAAVQSMGMGETISLPVDVHNWSTDDAERHGDDHRAGRLHARRDVEAVRAARSGGGHDGRLHAHEHGHDAARRGDQRPGHDDAAEVDRDRDVVLVAGRVGERDADDDGRSGDDDPDVGLGAGHGRPGGRVGLHRPRARPQPQVVRRRVQPGRHGLRHGRGAPATRRRRYARVAVNSDNLYFFVHIRDDFQSYAVTPQECVAHWLADSVEILIDPRGNSSLNNFDTGTTFKLGVFPFTNDPSNFNGNGVNGPCWERDADNHQGYATGPLAATVDDAPNAPGVQVVSTATWVGSNSTTVDHSYGAAGGYNLEVKIPLADLPAAVGPTASPPTGSAATNTIDPQHLGLNITPYDEDNTAAAGTTTLRHIDQSTRLALSNDTGGVQADPFRWGHAYIPGYTPPAGRSTTPTTPNVSHPNLDGVLSPQTIYQSAKDGVPISGRKPAPASDSIASSSSKLSCRRRPTFEVNATGPGTAHIFLWTGDHASIPVFLSSCAAARTIRRPTTASRRAR